MTESSENIISEKPGKKKFRPRKDEDGAKRHYGAPLIVLAVIFFLYSLTLIFPLLWLLYNSVKSRQEFFNNPWAFPQDILGNLANFGVVFTDFGLGEMLFNTIFLSVLCPLINLFCTTCVAYAYAKHTFKCRKLLYAVAMVPMLVSIAGTQPATYKLINNLGLYDSLFGILLMSTGGFGFNFMLISSLFINMSDAYREAAKIDGAGNWRIFLTIYVPQASNMLVALFILSFISTWNDYTTPFLYLPSHPTLATGIKAIENRLTVGNDPYQNDYPKLFACMIWSVLPVLVLFVIFQNKIMKFSLGGGVKG